MSRTTLPTASLAFALLISTPVLAQEAPSGASATRCDVSQFIPVISERTGRVMYWNNRTCPSAPGATDGTAAAAASPAPATIVVTASGGTRKRESEYENGTGGKPGYGPPDHSEGGGGHGGGGGGHGGGGSH